MVKVLFDHQTFSLQRYGGISRYFFNLYNAQQTFPEFKAEISLLYSRNYYTKDIKAPLNNFLGEWLLNEQKKNYKWNKKYSKFCISKNNFDVFHPTYYEPYFLKKLKKPYVLTIHDMIHELMPDGFKTDDVDAKNKRICAENAAHIIAISETTKKDIKNILGTDDDKISVIHHGYNNLNYSENSNPKPENNSYLLFVGERSNYKNFINFITGIQPILKKDKQIKVICAGGGSFTATETNFFAKLGVADSLTQISATDAQLSDLYKHAIAFVFPSLAEGFGLPILEAFQNNCPMIASDIACFNEIAGDAALYFNPLDPADILKQTEQLLNNQPLRDELVSKGLKRLSHFSMEKCISKTLDIYKSLAGS